MAGDARDRMVAGAVRLLAQRGLQATSFSEVIGATGAPRGSIYHHFPDGKDEMVAAALQLAGDHALQALEGVRGEPAESVAGTFLALWRQLLVASGFRAGCAVAAVVVATDSPALLDQTAAIFRVWRSSLAGLLEAGGVPVDEAARFAATLIAGSEGAVLLARAEQSLEPFDLVSEQLLGQARALTSA